MSCRLKPIELLGWGTRINRFNFYRYAQGSFSDASRWFGYKLWDDETGCGMEVISLSICVHRHAIYWYCCHEMTVRCQLALLEWPGGTHNMPAFICREFNFQIIKRNVERLQLFVVIRFLYEEKFQCEWLEGQVTEMFTFTDIQLNLDLQSPV